MPPAPAVGLATVSLRDETAQRSNDAVGASITSALVVGLIARSAAYG